VFRGGVETAVAHIVPDTFEVFLPDETVVVFLVGSAAGKRDVAGIAPGQEGPVDKLGAVIAVDAEKGEREGGLDVLKGLHGPVLGFIEEGTEFDPPGIDIGGVQSEVGPKVRNLPRVPFAAVVDRVNLEETGFPVVPGVMGAGLILRSFSLILGVMPNAGQASKKGICFQIRGARSFPQRYQKKAQIALRDAITSGP
jgi:hypothetical protein